MRNPLVFCLLGPLPLSLALQLPFKVPFFFSKKLEQVANVQPINNKVAIIGAGAGGSSAAFWIGKARERFGVDVEVEIYEQNSYIGGRSTTVYPYHNTSLPPIELGASIFVKSNRNLWRASDEFNFTRKDLRDEDYPVGIWDGQQLLFSVSSSWWDTFRMIWRYGIVSPRRTEHIVEEMVKNYLLLYSAGSPKWDNISDLASSLDMADLTTQTASTFFTSKGISYQYTSELIEAATRVNYGQNVDRISAMGGAVSLAASSSASIEGGNFRLFEKFIEVSNATLFLNTTVLSVQQKAGSHRWTVESSRGSAEYKAVILAAPLHYTDISIPSSLASLIPKHPYVHLHVTLLATTSQYIRPEFLNTVPGSKSPGMLLTTHEGARQGGPEPQFNSISYHAKINENEWVVKIFSKQAISDEFLEDAFGKGTVGWVYRKEWDAYPELRPTETHAPVKLDTGFYYVNAFETFISTMETETVASRNVVDLLLNEQFGSSICGATLSGPQIAQTVIEHYFMQDQPSNFVLGWDC